MTKNELIRDKIRLGSRTAKRGFETERDVVDKFNNWRDDEDAQQWLTIMGYDLKEIEKVKAIIITGSKRCFAAGGDIREILSLETPVDSHNFFKIINSPFHKIEILEKPVIAAISGFALGGGCELALVCDLRFAADNAVFGLPEIKIGMIPGAGGTQRLPRLIGTGNAKELLFLGESINAQEAYRIGLVNKVVPINSLMEEARNTASALAKGSTIALAMIKAAVNKGINMELSSALAYEARCLEVLFSTEDQKEGLISFKEKRRPIFKGK